MNSEQLFAGSIPEPNSGCWLWLGALNRKGYPKSNGREMHRESYRVHKGPIPDGGFVLHSCDQRSCINPDHLRVGCHADNMADMVKRGRAAGAKGESHGSAKLTEEDVRAIRLDDRSLRRVAASYGVHFTLIAGIRSRKYWPHI